MGPSWIQILIVVGIAVLLFGGYKHLPRAAKDIARSFRSFQSGLKEGEDEAKQKDGDGAPKALNSEATTDLDTSSANTSGTQSAQNKDETRTG